MDLNRLDAKTPHLGNAAYSSRERWADRGYGLNRFKAFLATRYDFFVPLERCAAAQPPVLAPSAAALLNVGRLPMLAASIAAFVEGQR